MEHLGSPSIQLKIGLIVYHQLIFYPFFNKRINNAISMTNMEMLQLTLRIRNSSSRYGFSRGLRYEKPPINLIKDV